MQISRNRLHPDSAIYHQLEFSCEDAQAFEEHLLCFRPEEHDDMKHHRYGHRSFSVSISSSAVYQSYHRSVSSYELPQSK
jgi:hypothetical protein